MNNLLKILCFFCLAIFLLACESTTKEKDIKDQKRSEIMIETKTRNQIIGDLKKEVFDVLIIGGGAIGAGSLLEAQSRGLKAALIEKEDFSFGTSSKSTKLVHGGIRYLEKAFKNLDYTEYKLVKEALKERSIFLKNAPHLTNKLKLITPVYSFFDAVYYWAGLKFYDLIAKKASLGSSEFISKEDALKIFPYLQKVGLKGAVLFYDGQFNDARMDISLIITAMGLGAIASNYVSCTSILKNEGKVSGVMAHDSINGESFPIKAKAVINTAGVFADTIRKMDDESVRPLLKFSRGSHVVISSEFSKNGVGLLIPKTSDGRVLFMLPWLSHTIVGTTEVEDILSDSIKINQDETDYILEHLKKYIDKPILKKDILSTFSGLRPLVNKDALKETKDISREHFIEVSKSGLITLVGGKWTTYRKMGEEVIDLAILKHDLNQKNPSVTTDLKLIGSRHFKKSLLKELMEFESLPIDIAQNLVLSYGDRVDEVLNIDERKYIKKLDPDHPFIEAEVIYAVRYEFAQKPLDIISRRMRLSFLDYEASLKVLPKVVSLMAKELSWNEEEQKLKIDESLRELELYNK